VDADRCLFFYVRYQDNLAILDIPISAKRDRYPLNANIFRSVSGFLAWGSVTGLLLFSLPFYPDEKRQD